MTDLSLSNALPHKNLPKPGSDSSLLLAFCRQNGFCGIVPNLEGMDQSLDLFVDQRYHNVNRGGTVALLLPHKTNIGG